MNTPLSEKICGIASSPAKVLQVFLQQMHDQFPHERIGVVLDNAPSHRSHQMVWPSEMVPLALPASSPELNQARAHFSGSSSPLSQPNL